MRDIVNLHNASGIKSIAQIDGLTQAIHDHDSRMALPWASNIKLARSRRDEWVLFDGHHTALAFMNCGRVFLSEVPHTLVYGRDGGVSDDEIAVFFGEHGKQFRDWRPYVINWQAPEESQLERRVERTMGELFDAIHWLLQGAIEQHLSG